MTPVMSTRQQNLFDAEPATWELDAAQQRLVASVVLAAGPEGLFDYVIADAYADAARVAHEAGLGVNAGHDLDLHNLVLFRTLPHLDEVSIGHALISHALFVGLRRSVHDYLAAVAGPPA